MRACLLSFTLILLAGAPLLGQSVVGIRDLDFGVVIRGVPTGVLPSDPIRSGRFYVQYTPSHPVQVRFTLPTQLARVGGGGSLAIRFGSTDGMLNSTAPNSSPVIFDPNKTRTFNSAVSGDFYLDLGGQVTPTAAQPAGAYSGTIVLTVIFL
jgi:hypothetical protein